MTAKEKAEELLKKCFSPDFEDGQDKYFASLIVDQIIASGPTMPSELKDTYWIAVESASKYWEEVLEEINK